MPANGSHLRESVSPEGGNIRNHQEFQMPAGRPTKYRPQFADQAKKLCKLGAIDLDVAEFFGVSESTLYRWKDAHQEFREALNAGKGTADEQVEKSLFNRALGYKHRATKFFQAGQKIISQEYVEHYPPDTTACIFWLKNRRPDEWRDKVEQAHSFPEGVEFKVTRAKAG